jgi:hypothetical protein
MTYSTSYCLMTNLWIHGLYVCSRLSCYWKVCLMADRIRQLIAPYLRNVIQPRWLCVPSFCCMRLCPMFLRSVRRKNCSVGDGLRLDVRVIRSDRTVALSVCLSICGDGMASSCTYSYSLPASYPRSTSITPEQHGKLGVETPFFLTF